MTYVSIHLEVNKKELHFTDYINKLIVNCAYIPSLNMIYCQYKVFSLSFNNVLVVGTSLKKLDFLHSGFGGQTL